MDIAKRVTELSSDEKVVFVIAGNGSFRNRIRNRIVEKEMDGKILMTGLLDTEGVKELLADSYLFVLVSWIEGIPLTIVEALSMGVPVVATEAGAVREVVRHQENGCLLHPVKDVVETAARTLVHLLRETGSRERLARQARPSIREEFSLEKYGERVAALFNEMCGGSK